VLLACGPLLVASPRAWSNPAQVAVVANRNVPASEQLARYYMQQRGIPAENLCLLDLPEGEVISRGDYEERLRDPLLARLRDAGLIEQSPRPPREVKPHETPWNTGASSIRYLVSMYGVPLRIADTKFDLLAKLAARMKQSQYTNSAAVDSELVLLLYPGHDIANMQTNPLFNRISLAQLAVPAHLYLMATRLDGPDPETVRSMIDGAIRAESEGLHGRAYFDSSEHGDTYALGDFWIEGAYECFKRAGYECEIDGAPGMWGNAFPMEDAAVYLGWYAEHVVGPFTLPGFRFRSGAVAYHLHSTSAATLRETNRNWAAPLLKRGAAVTMGAVSEPYLQFMPHLDVFAERLCSGHTFGEAAYMSLSHVSWQVTVVGDPLYTPFRLSPDEQLARLESLASPDREWAYLRKVNLLLRDGKYRPAARLCAEQAERLDSMVLREKLANMYADNELMEEAGQQFEKIIRETTSAQMAARAGRRWTHMLREADRGEEADMVGKDLLDRWPGSPFMVWMRAE
jgi:uncharacterized protein (TIGR03790 family)